MNAFNFKPAIMTALIMAFSAPAFADISVNTTTSNSAYTTDEERKREEERKFGAGFDTDIQAHAETSGNASASSVLSVEGKAIPSGAVSPTDI